MNRSIQIFRKDVVHLRPQILAFVGLLIAFVIDDRRSAGFNLDGLLFLGLPLSCWLLVTSLIQDEKPAGDRQDWLTRPFRRTDLLAAKALFLAMFLMAPVFVCQAFILSATPQSPGVDVGALVAKQAFFLAWYLLPIAAMAAVTRNLGEALVGSLLVLLIFSTFLSIVSRSGWNGLTWIRETLAAVVALSGAALVIYLQYTRRRAALGRGALGGVLLLVGAVSTLPPLQAAFRVQSWLSSTPVDPHAVRISFDDRQSGLDNPVYGNSRVYYRIPLKVEDVPTGLELVADWISMESPWQSAWSASVDMREDKPGWSLLLEIPPSVYVRMKNDSIRLRGSLALTLVAPMAWQCREEAYDSVYCLWNPEAFAPFPTSPWFGPPLERYKRMHPLTHPVAHIQRSFDLGPLRLADYVVKK